MSTSVPAGVGDLPWFATFYFLSNIKLFQIFHYFITDVCGYSLYYVFCIISEGTAPTNVMVTIQQSPSRVMVTWDPPPADADMVTSYIVYYDGVESFVNDGNVTVTMRSATIDLPEEFVTYRITIQAMFGGTLGVPSQAVSIMTLSSGKSLAFSTTDSCIDL